MVVGPFVLYRVIDSVSATASSCVPGTIILLVTLNVVTTGATDPRSSAIRRLAQRPN